MECMGQFIWLLLYGFWKLNYLRNEQNVWKKNITTFLFFKFADIQIWCDCLFPGCWNFNGVLLVFFSIIHFFETFLNHQWLRRYGKSDFRFYMHKAKWYSSSVVEVRLEIEGSLVQDSPEALCHTLSKTLYPLPSTSSTQAIFWNGLKIVYWDIKHQLKQNKRISP